MVTNKISFYIKRLCCTLFSVLLLTFPAYSAEFSDNFHFNGFFTLDSTVTDADIYLISNSDHTIPYEENSVSLQNSLLGGQLSYAITDNLSAVVQGKIYDESNVKALNNDDSIAQLDWAYLSYDLGADFNLRAGQFIIPFMQGTELRSVGFSRLWARPLIPSSGAGGYNAYVGVEVLKNLSVGSGNWDFQLAVGKTEHNQDEIDSQHMELLAVRYQQGNFWLRTALFSTEYDIYTIDGRIIQDSAKAVMFSTETEYQLANFILNAGFSTSSTDITPDSTNLYLSLGYRFNSFTPYVLHARANQFFEIHDLPDRLQLDSPPAGQRPLPPPIPIVPEGDKDIYHWAVGARYDFAERYALKIQLEHIKEENDANFPENNGEGNALTIVLEGIF